MADLFNQQPAETRPAEDIAAICGEFKATHHTAEVTGRQHLEAARKCGQLLVKLKNAVPHGKFHATIRQYCPGVSIRTVQNYLWAVANWTKISKAGSLRAALRVAHEDPETVEEECDSEPSGSQIRNAAYLDGDDNPEEDKELGNEKQTQPGVPETPAAPTKPEEPTKEETAFERSRRKINEVLEELAKVDRQLTEIITGPGGPQLLELAEELKVPISREFIGQTDRFDRESVIHGQRVYFAEGLTQLVKLLNAFHARVAKPVEMEF